MANKNQRTVKVLARRKYESQLKANKKKNRPPSKTYNLSAYKGDPLLK